MTFIFNRVKRPEPIVPFVSLDEELEKSADDATLTLYFINMVVMSGSLLPDVETFTKSDPYCEVFVGGISDKTAVIDDDLNPVWNESMNFFIPKKPDKITMRILCEHSVLQDELMGKAEFEFGDLFDVGGTFEGDIKLNTEGSVRIKLKCRIMKPIETEIKLGYTENKFAMKQEEQTATIVALDESEQLREEAIKELSSKEQEIITKAEELAEKQRLHQSELSEKNCELLDQADLIEEKIQQYEDVQIALKETELKK